MFCKEISITNKTLNLSDCREAWIFDKKHNCWCLEDILYTEKATTPKFQRLSIFVPEPYMKNDGAINQKGEMNGYTAETAPVIFENNSAGYMQMPHVWLDGPRCYAKQYLDHGFVYVTCGNRGSESTDADGKLCGKAPINLVDLKMAIRFLRHNRAVLPGDYRKIISVGWSAGGAMSMLLGVTGDNCNYDGYLREAGAFMEESDAIFAAQCYCPIIDLEHADLAYEWMFHEDKESENSPAGPAEIMNPFKDALSQKLKEKYIAYFNNLKLVDENGTAVRFGEDGRSGSAYDFLMKKLEESATKFLQKLEKGGLHRDGEFLSYSAQDYLKGNYTLNIPAPMGTEKDNREEHSNSMQGFAGQGVALGEIKSEEKNMQEPLSLGDLVARPPKGQEFHGFVPPVIRVQGDKKGDWLYWNGKEAKIKDLDSYILNHRRRMKGCTSFDTLTMDSGENRVFGSEECNYMHFNVTIADALEELREEFPKEYEKYYDAYRACEYDKELKERMYLINPLSYIGTNEISTQADYFRIRVGSRDADTSFSVSMTAALKLAQAGKQTDYAFVWDMPHSEADYDGEVLSWIDRIVGIKL